MHNFFWDTFFLLSFIKINKTLSGLFLETTISPAPPMALHPWTSLCLSGKLQPWGSTATCLSLILDSLNTGGKILTVKFEGCCHKFMVFLSWALGLRVSLSTFLAQHSLVEIPLLHNSPDTFHNSSTLRLYHMASISICFKNLRLLCINFKLHSTYKTFIPSPSRLESHKRWKR